MVYFDECERCHKFHDRVACRCDKTTEVSAVRIQGRWKVYKITKGEAYTKIHFNQGNEKLIHVQFHNSTDEIKFIEGQEYNLIGWQKIQNRHNILVITV